MIHIAICDDEKDFVQHLTGLVEHYSKESGESIKITPYYDGMDLIEKYDPSIDLIAINYLMLDIGGRIFKAMTHATYEETLVSPELTLISTAIHTFSLFLRLLFWVGAWLVLRRFLSKISSHLTLRMWLIVDMLVLASFVAIFTILYFMPEDTLISYPICGASIFSSFGCMYLASYICDSMQTAYRAQELQMQKDYYKDRIREQTRHAGPRADSGNRSQIMRIMSIPGTNSWISSSGTNRQKPGINTLTSTLSSILKTEISWSRWISARYLEMPSITPLRQVKNSLKTAASSR